LGLAGKVIFHGDVGAPQQLMKDWDLFVYGTTEREGLGGTVPEALSIGLPVVASDLPMVREWDQDGAFITYCKPFDPSDMAAMAIALLNDLPRLKEIFEQSPLFINKHYSPLRFATNYIDIQTTVTA
jgi:glycosyltransferase involved in cell wall biosynthesis